MSTRIREAEIGTATVTPLPLVAANVPDVSSHGIARNPGMPLDLGFLEAMRYVNRSALERRVASMTKRRSIKADNQAAWLLRAIALMDLTTLNSNDTDERVRRLCAKALNPLRPDIAEGLGVAEAKIRPAAVCVYHPFVATAVDALKGSGVHVAAVSTAFPHGLAPLSTRLQEIEASVKDGADEIDVVIPRGLVYGARWQELYDEIVAMRAACGEAHLKVILGTGDLSTLRNVTLASMVAMMAGADFIKTSTGKESVNATLPVGLAMVRAIRAYFEATGYLIGFKPAGGISTAKSALDWLVLMKEELGRPWLEPELFRFGASSLLTDIERQLEHHLTGHYSAGHRHAMA
ncbi:2-deoxyribose-5-phosphate aldolase [Mesorhizobium sp. L-8-10]|uniref:deoxyribose-phosphate aldolase n=1 Tax=unclassified Mesorhizobium TaxID=325217 RepID=UPI001928B51C|nr:MULTISPECIES: deoxyribose-phosphate aldolase [unclassified Mesorhizobium]BCH20928.1 2-deoxyribose-5-phosphate aldolase [Mesorhizobium sp. L-8-3]BCH28755.1 2-deoxyribose-5-phosphate aldolase [Mesorhizobium sp. L-8-10]